MTIKKMIEWIGTHPFATGLMAIVGLISAGFSIYEITATDPDHVETQKKLDQIKISSDASGINSANTSKKADDISSKIDGLAAKMDDVGQKPAKPKTAQEGHFPAVVELPYDIARPKIIDAGWIPVKRRWQLIGEYAYREWPLWHHGFEEVHACAGTGRAECRFEFHNGSKTKLIVITYGEIQAEIDSDKKRYVGRPNFGNFRVGDIFTEKIK